MKTLTDDLLEKIRIAKQQMSDQLDKSGENFDHKLIANLADRVKDDVGDVIHAAILEMNKIPMPNSGKQASFLNVTAAAAAAAIGLLAMGTMHPEDLRDTHGPDEVTRDHMLFAALFAVATETQTDEGKKMVVDLAAKFAAGDTKALPGALAHHWFDMIRGYRFKSSGVCQSQV